MNSNQLAPEWAYQRAIILAWPHSNSDWAANLDEIEKIYIVLSKSICEYQLLIIVAYNDSHLLHIKKLLINLSVNIQNILFVTIPTNDIWIRDYGPVYINSNDRLTFLNFEFDGWGQKYNYKLDNAFNSKLINQLKIDAYYYRVDQVLEAGNIDINNRGELLCGANCFKRKIYTSSNELTDLEELFINWFGCNQVYMITGVKLIGDDTDGHIDTLARFCSDDIIVYSSTGNSNDANNEALDFLYTQLESIKKLSNNRFDIIPLPLPDPIFSFGKQLPATYANFLITNKTVLVPTFNDKQDRYVLKLFDELFPTRKIIGINSITLIKQFGGLHCTAMQIPKNSLHGQD